jgi:hypothetical protein
VVDVFMPGGSIGKSEPESYPGMVNKLKKNVEFCLEHAGDRPVLAFHSPRHTHSGCIRVDNALWASHIAQTFAYEYQGKRAAGVIIWDPTILMYVRGELEETDAEYLVPGMDMVDYITALEMSYYCSGAKSVIPDAECSVPPEGHLLGDLVDFVTFAPPGDGVVSGADLAYLLMQWGANPGSPADIVKNDFLPPGDGVVNSLDLAVLLGNWTP